MASKQNDDIMNALISKVNNLNLNETLVKICNMPEYVNDFVNHHELQRTTDKTCILYNKHYSPKQIGAFLTVAWIVENLRTCEQRSEKWRQFRATIIGGSEMSAIVGTDKFNGTRAIYYLIQSKLEIKSSIHGMPVWWGVVFEQVIHKYSEQVYDMKIVVPGSLAGKHGTAYSPDGLGVTASGKICLFEFKCTFNRELENDIPETYKPQVKSGLDNIGIVDKLIYMETIFRNCSFDDVKNNNSINLHIHKKPELVENYAGPIMIGVICTYQDKPIKANGVSESEFLEDVFIRRNQIYSMKDEYEKKFGKRLIDFGKYHMYNLCKYTHQYNDTTDDKINYWYSDMMEVREDTSDHEMKKFIMKELSRFAKFVDDNDHEEIGFLCWKLFNVHTATVKRRPHHDKYIEQYKEKISQVLGVIKELREYPIEHRQEKLDEFWKINQII
jgi:hypothetical protein